MPQPIMKRFALTLGRLPVLILVLLSSGCATHNYDYSAHERPLIAEGQKIKVGDFNNLLGFDEPNKTRFNVTLTEPVSDVVRNAVISELKMAGFDTGGGPIRISGDIHAINTGFGPPHTSITFKVEDTTGNKVLFEERVTSPLESKSIDDWRGQRETLRDTIARFLDNDKAKSAMGIMMIPRWQKYRTAAQGKTKAVNIAAPSSGKAAGSSPPANIRKLAVMDLEAIGVEDEVSYALSDYLRDEIHAQGGYEVLSREDLDALARRTSLQQQAGSCVDTGCLVEFGKALGTKYMVAGSISKLGNTYSVSLRLLDTEGDQVGVKNRVNERCRCSEEELFGVIEKIAGEIIN